MKKSEYIIVIFLSILIILFTNVIAQGTEIYNLGLTEISKLTPEERAKWYGYNLDKFIENIDLTNQEQSISDYLNEFQEGLKKSLENNPSKLKKISELWTEKYFEGTYKDKYKLGDYAKNAIWGALNSKQKQSHLKELMKQGIKKRNIEVNDEIFEKKVKSLELNDDKLVWRENKLGIEEQGKLKGWIDFDNIPQWTTSIKYENGKFEMNFDTLFSTKKVLFSQGTIGSEGEIKGPNGKTIGQPAFSGIKNINYNNGKLEITYEDLVNKEKKLSFTKQELSDSIKQKKQELSEELDKLKSQPTTSDKEKAKATEKEIAQLEKIRGLFEILDDPVLGPKINEVVNGLAFDLSLSGTTNELNVLYGKGENEVIELTYDNNGKLKVALSNKATLVSTDGSNNVKNTYIQFNLEDDAQFLFKHNGDIEAAKNGAIRIKGVGDVFTSKRDFVGVEVREDGFLGALLRGDIETAVNALLENSALTKNAEKGILPVKLEDELIKLINKKIKSESFNSEFRKSLNEILSSLVSSLEQTGNTLTDYFLSLPNEPENPVRESIKRVLSEQTKNAIQAILGDPNKVKVLATGTKQEKRNMIGEVLKPLLNDPEVRRYFRPLTEGIAAQDAEFKPEQLGDFVEKVLKESNPKTEFREIIKEKLAGYIDDEKIRSSILAVLSQYETKIDEESRAFQDRLSKDYENKIIIDAQTGQVTAIGNEYIAFDARSPLTRFSAKSTRTSKDQKDSVIVLYNNGNYIAQFDGDKTYTNRVVGNDYYSIQSIINERIKDSDPTRELKLEKASGPYNTGYRLYYPGLLQIRGGGVTAGGLGENFLILHETANIPSEGDLARNPNAEIIFYDYSDNLPPTTKGFLRKFLRYLFNKRELVGGEVRKNIPYGFPAYQIAEKIEQGYREEVEKAYQGNGGKDQFERSARSLLETYEALEREGLPVSIDQVRLDKLKSGLNSEGIVRVTQFLRQFPSASTVKITPSYIEVDGVRLQGVDPSYIREIFRSAAQSIKWEHKGQ